MAEFTLEGLAAQIQEMQGKLATAETTANNAAALANEAKNDAATAFTSAGEAESKATNALALAEEAKSEAANALSAAFEAGKPVKGELLSVGDSPAKEEKPKIPEGEFEHDGKKYRFTRAKFRLAGDPTLHKSSEVAATAGDAEGIFAKILKIEGQDILKVVE